VEVVALIIRVCLCLVAKMSDRCVDVCSGLSVQMTKFLSEIITGNETWCFQYDREIKRGNAENPRTQERKSSSLSSYSRLLFTFNSFYKAK